jgi:hypothetical protein
VFLLGTFYFSMDQVLVQRFCGQTLNEGRLGATFCILKTLNPSSWSDRHDAAALSGTADRDLAYPTLLEEGDAHWFAWADDRRPDGGPDGTS